MSDYTVQWQLWNDIDLAVAEIVETNGLKDTVYYDGMFELYVDVTGGIPGCVEMHFLEMPWFFFYDLPIRASWCIHSRTRSGYRSS